MDRLKGLATFVGYAAGLFLALRVVHVLAPLVRPELRRGALVVARVEEVPAYLGFAPWVPYYRPETLGTGPAVITVTPDPRPTVSIDWEGTCFLRLVESRSPATEAPPGSWPIPNRPGAYWWQDGVVRRARVQHDDVRIDLETNLSLEDFHRVIDTLRAAKERR